MGGRGASSGLSGGGAIAAGERDLDFSKVGASFSKLPPHLKNNINENLKMSSTMKRDILNGKGGKITDEWVTGKGSQKIKVLTGLNEGKLGYTVKQRNKILAKNTTKERAANLVARFYLDLFK